MGVGWGVVFAMSNILDVRLGPKVPDPHNTQRVEISIVSELVAPPPQINDIQRRLPSLHRTPSPQK